MAVVPEKLEGQSLRQTARRKGAERFVAGAFIIFKNAAGQHDGFKSARLHRRQHEGQIQRVVLQRGARVEVGAFIIRHVGGVMAKQVEAFLARQLKKVFRTERRVRNETTERFQLFHALPADVSVSRQIAGNWTDDFMSSDGEIFYGNESPNLSVAHVFT